MYSVCKIQLRFYHLVQTGFFMDRLSSLLELFSPTAQKVNLVDADQLLADFTGDSSIAVVHRGSAELRFKQGEKLHIAEGDILWLTSNKQPVLSAQQADFQLLCCHLRFGPVRLNPLFDMIPEVLHLKADTNLKQSLNPIIELLLQESQNPRCGQETVLNRLAEVLLVQILRYVMKHQKIESGVLAGLADIRLARAITAIHSQPEQRWSVQTLAEQAGMSRTAFNQHFRETVGCTPGEYLMQWRMRLACRWLEHSQTMIGQIVDKLGYRSETAFFRAFRRQVGMSPRKYRLTATTEV